MSEKKPFRDAKVGDLVKAPVFGGSLAGKIIEVMGATVVAEFGSGEFRFLEDGSFFYAMGTNAARALWYTNDKGELLEERPKKMVEKVVVSGKTDAWDYSKEKSGISLIVSVLPTIPVGTPYRIIVEVEE